MPSPRGLPNPQLIPLPIATPGALGLNLQAQNAVLPPTWSIENSNTVIDPVGRVAARLGRHTVTTTAAAGPIRTIFEYRTSTGASLPFVAFDGGISSSVANPTTNSLVGTIASVASGRWYFANYMDTCIGIQAGQGPIVLPSVGGTFSQIVASSGTLPTGGVGTAAFGRLWIVDGNGFTLKFCALGDYTNWGAGDSGSIDLRHVWPLGQDTVTAIQGWNGTLVIFGTRQIVMYGSTNPSVLGLDVTQLQVVDAVEGVGCISQWTVAPIGAEIETSDLLFCSTIGVSSLQRLLVNRSRPIQQLTKNVRDALLAQLASETPANVSGFYSPTNGFYALSLPNAGYTWIVDQRHRFTDQDGDDVARITRWPFANRHMVETSTRAVYFASTAANAVQQHLPGNDDGSNFQVVLQIPWADFGDNLGARLKALKRVGGIFGAASTVNVTFTWFTDFNLTGTSTQTQLTGNSSAYWGIAQWGLDQWGGGVMLSITNVNASGTGQYFSLAITASAGSDFTVQQLNMLAKLLRVA